MDVDTFAARLWSLPRSLTGNANRQTLVIIGETVPLKRHEVPSGTKFWSWTVPDEWNIRHARIQDLNSDWHVDWADNYLHLLGYSTPSHHIVPGHDLDAHHLYSLPDQPDAIPYLTSYYKDRWGFCLTEKKRRRLDQDSQFEVTIDGTKGPGHMSWAEAYFKGRTRDEVLFSTYICHPNLANDNLSGMIVATALAEYVQSIPNRRYSYRFVFAPETLGTLAYLDQAFTFGREPVAGFVLTTLGGPGPFVFKPSKRGDTLADRVVRHVTPLTEELPFVATGADERYFCSPKVDWPVAVIGKPMFHTYPEYHTSLDDLDYMSSEDVEESIHLYMDIIDSLEANRRYWTIDPGIPKLDEKGLYPTLGAAIDQKDKVRRVMETIMYSDGEHDLIDIANRLDEPVTVTALLADEMVEKGVLEEDS